MLGVYNTVYDTISFLRLQRKDKNILFNDDLYNIINHAISTSDLWLRYKKTTDKRLSLISYRSGIYKKPTTNKQTTIIKNKNKNVSYTGYKKQNYLNLSRQKYQYTTSVLKAVCIITSVIGCQTGKYIENKCFIMHNLYKPFIAF